MLNINTILGLDISDRSIEVLGLKKRFLKKPKIAAYGRLELGAGVVEGGNIEDFEALAEALRILLKSAWPGPIKEKLVVALLPQSQIFSRIFRLPPGIYSEDLKTVVLNEVASLDNIRLEEIYYDWQVVKRNKEETMVFFEAARKDLVFDYTNVLGRAGLIPVAFEAEAAAAGRALLDLTQNEAVVIIDIGALATNVNYFEDGYFLGSLSVPVGGNSATVALAKELNESLERAEAIKREVGFDADKEAVLAALEGEFSVIVERAKDFIKYFSQMSGREVEKIILSGGGALIPNIENYFQINFDLEVEQRDPLRKIYLPGCRGIKDFIYYANVVGLALRGLHPQPYKSGINLLARAEYR